MASEAENELNHSKAGGRGRAEPMSYGHPWWLTSPIQELNNGNGFSLQYTGTPLNRANAQKQARKQVPSSVPEHVGQPSNPQMEQIGSSIGLTSHAFQDPTYGGVVAYTQQVNPEHYGIHQSRMAVPIATDDEPVYVNAKQYHGILRRRQIRARAELEKKIVKNKKPYLHESRHKHALRRARGAGGRFLNTKKLDENNDNNLEELNINERQPSDTSFSDHISLNYSANASWQQESRGMMILDKHKGELHSSDIHGVSATYHSLSSSSNDGRGEMTRNGFVSVT